MGVHSNVCQVNTVENRLCCSQPSLQTYVYYNFIWLAKYFSLKISKTVQILDTKIEQILRQKCS